MRIKQGGDLAVVTPSSEVGRAMENASADTDKGQRGLARYPALTLGNEWAYPLVVVGK